jgi:ATP-dependent DNA helicase RecG
MVHGQMKGEERDATMTAFREGRVSVLVASSVIEVGVDVPNATLMVIQDAERFGLAQLHQLRGRVRRSGREAFCVLVTGREDPEARQRLRVLEESTDGLAIAEADLGERGPGELLGAAQSGMAPLRFADFVRDGSLLTEARAVVARILARSEGRKASPGSKF